MQKDFHYYATYCAAALAGYNHGECLEICHSAQFVDECTRTFLSSIGGPAGAATTQTTIELADIKKDLAGRQDITRIWSSFHFLPRDLYAEVKKAGKKYKSKYRLICGPNGPLLADTVRLAKGKDLAAVGLAMHVLADTWAHANFAGTPSMAINNTNTDFYEIIPVKDTWIEKQVRFSLRHGEDLANSIYIRTVSINRENSIMSLGHGQAGHLPDYSCIRYRYMPPWGDYMEILKDNPADYYHAFCQMIYAMQYLRGETEAFETDHYAFEAVEPFRSDIEALLEKRQLDDSEDWKQIGKKITGRSIEDYDIDPYTDEWRNASPETREQSFLGQFISAALAQKSMVTSKIYESGNLLAGYVSKGKIR